MLRMKCSAYWVYYNNTLLFIYRITYYFLWLSRMLKKIDLIEKSDLIGKNPIYLKKSWFFPTLILTQNRWPCCVCRLTFDLASYVDRNLLKLAVGGGAVYVTVEEGVWSSSNNSCKALDRVRTRVLPDTSEYIDQVRWRRVDFPDFISCVYSFM